MTTLTASEYFDGRRMEALSYLDAKAPDFRPELRTLRHLAWCHLKQRRAVECRSCDVGDDLGGAA